MDRYREWMVEQQRAPHKVTLRVIGFSSRLPLMDQRRKLSICICCASLFQSMSAERKILFVEDLVADPDLVMRGLAQFLEASCRTAPW